MAPRIAALAAFLHGLAQLGHAWFGEGRHQSHQPPDPWMRGLICVRSAALADHSPRAVKDTGGGIFAVAVTLDSKYRDLPQVVVAIERFEMQKKLILHLAAALCMASGAAVADNVLLINGSGRTPSPSTTTGTTNNWLTTCGAGHTVTVADTPPASLAGYQQVWDLRFANQSPLTTADQAAYLAYLQSGGRMFVMGENSNLGARNATVIDFIDTAGGGALTFVEPGNAQTVTGVPFTDGGLSTIVWWAAGGTTTPGSGVFAASNANGGSAIVWRTGTLANAPTGTLAVVFDVSFMEPPSRTPNEDQFFRNLCAFGSMRGGGAAVAVPANSPWALWSLACALGLAAMVILRKRRHN